MKNWIFSLIFLFLISCKGEKSCTYFTHEKAAQYFTSIEDICNRDNGELWGQNLYGPIMFVDRVSRRIVANIPDNEGLLKEKDGLYIGLYPKELIISNTPVNYGGTLIAMTPLPNTDSPEEYKTKLFENLDRIYSMQSYSRSYGFIHGALYATLLNDKGFDFSQIQTKDFDLGNAVKELYNIELPEICRDVAGSIAVNYNIDAINNEEEQRLADIKESIHKQISIFTEKPVVFLELESPYFDFEPEDIHVLDTLGTLYSSIRVSDNWGKLTVNKWGCLVSNNFKFLRITAKGFKADENHIAGEGWILILNNGWELAPVDQNYFVRKIMP